MPPRASADGLWDASAAAAAPRGFGSGSLALDGLDGMLAEEMDADPCVAAMRVETEEGKKVARAGANKYYTVYQRIASDEVEENLISADSFWDEGQFGVRKVKE